jgi:hypothetical protein
MSDTNDLKLTPKFRRVYGGRGEPLLDVIDVVFEYHGANQRPGCGGCRSRHIRCDKGVPSCGQCLKKRIECPGYLRQFTFIDGPSVRAKRRKPNPDASLTIDAADPNLTSRLGSPSINAPERTLPPWAVPSISVSMSLGDEGNQSPGEERKDTIDMTFRATKPPTPASMPTFYDDHTENCRRRYFLGYYFDQMADSFSILEGPANPFGESFKQYAARSNVLTCALISMSAAYREEMAYGWHYRAAALNAMQRALFQPSYSVEMLAAVLFLGTTEVGLTPQS